MVDGGAIGSRSPTATKVAGSRRDVGPHTDPVLQHECVVSELADLLRVRKSLVERADIGEAASRRDQGERGPGLAAKEEESGVALRSIRSLLRFGVEIEEDCLAGADVVDHAIQR